MEESFKIKSYGIGKLARLYCPDVHPHTALRKLNEWIDLYPGLRQQLLEAGMKPGSRIFTPAQVKLIVDALGEP